MFALKIKQVSCIIKINIRVVNLNFEFVSKRKYWRGVTKFCFTKLMSCEAFVPIIYIRATT